MSEMPFFTSQGWYRLRGVGWAAAVPCDRVRDRQNPFPIGTIVKIDGEEFEVIGVERHLLGGPIRKGEVIGLAVREPLCSRSDHPLAQTQRVLRYLRESRETFGEDEVFVDHISDAIKEIERLAALVRAKSP
jgi:hypothetical protein